MSAPPSGQTMPSSCEGCQGNAWEERPACGKLEAMLSIDRLLVDFPELARRPDPDLARPALTIARLEYPRLDPAPYLAQLDQMGAEVAARLARGRLSPLDRLGVLNAYLFGELGFSGDRERYDDPRNSLLNQVLERRIGIPISLAIVYMEVARRAGVLVEGVNFPGHFLLRAPLGRGGGRPAVVILDPFHRGAVLSEDDCRRLLRDHVGEDAVFDRRLLAPATKIQILARMLVNLKRTYVRYRSFPQAYAVTELLLALDPSATTELRDRGLLAYHLHDYAAALRDLEAYLRLSGHGRIDRADAPAEEAAGDPEAGGEEQPVSREQTEIWEHIKTLRRRLASFN
jgi:regulator of sirC expression with transglutaminase-like and TPR domain